MWHKGAPPRRIGVNLRKILNMLKFLSGNGLIRKIDRKEFRKLGVKISCGKSPHEKMRYKGAPPRRIGVNLRKTYNVLKPLSGNKLERKIKRKK
jgi:hypothetical protein